MICDTIVICYAWTSFLRDAGYTPTAWDMFFQTFLPGVLVLREWSQWGVCRDETELHQAERREPRLTKRHV